MKERHPKHLTMHFIFRYNSDCYEIELLPTDYLILVQITNVIVLLVIHNCNLTASVSLTESLLLCLLMFNKRHHGVEFSHQMHSSISSLLLGSRAFYLKNIKEGRYFATLEENAHFTRSCFRRCS